MEQESWDADWLLAAALEWLASHQQPNHPYLTLEEHSQLQAQDALRQEASRGDGAVGGGGGGKVNLAGCLASPALFSQMRSRLRRETKEEKDHKQPAASASGNTKVNRAAGLGPDSTAAGARSSTSSSSTGGGGDSTAAASDSKRRGSMGVTGSSTSRLQDLESSVGKYNTMSSLVFSSI